MKHNQAVTDIHFRKDWKRHVHTWFKQPFRKQRRHTTRVTKARRQYPNPIKDLRPSVHCCTQRYNYKLRLGRGFSLKELALAKIEPKMARTVGIAVDPRRINHSRESIMRNVRRLQEYKARLTVLPRSQPKAARVDAIKKKHEERKAKRLEALDKLVGEHTKKIAELKGKLGPALAEYAKTKDVAKAKEIKTVKKALRAEIKACRQKKAGLVKKHPEVFRPLTRLPIKAIDAAKAKQVSDPNKVIRLACCKTVELQKLTKGMVKHDAYARLMHNRNAAKAVGGMEKGKKTIAANAAKKEKAKK